MFHLVINILQEGAICSCRFFMTRCTCKHQLAYLLALGKIGVPPRFALEVAEARSKSVSLKSVRTKRVGAPRRVPPPGKCIVVTPQLNGPGMECCKQHVWSS